MDQPDLFAEAAAAAEAGMTQVEDNTDAEWNDYADDYIDTYLRQHRTLHVDDLWAAGLERPRNARALGPRIAAAARAGKMTKTGRHRASISSHLSAKPVWRSLIYEGDKPMDDQTSNESAYEWAGMFGRDDVWKPEPGSYLVTVDEHQCVTIEPISTAELWIEVDEPEDADLTAVIGDGFSADRHIHLKQLP